MENIYELIIAIVGIIAAGSGIYAFLQDKNARLLLKNITDVVKKVKEIKSPNSEKGEKVSSKEAKETVEELLEIVTPLEELLKVHFPKLARKLGLNK